MIDVRCSRVLLCVVLAFGAAGAAPLAAAVGHVDESAFSERAFGDMIGYLAGDELEGRGTGQPGIDRAAEYIADEFRRYGLEPAGDDGTYFQNFELQLNKRVGDNSRLAVRLHGRPTRRPLTLREQYVPLPYSSEDFFNGDVVFVGYGISSDAAAYDDYAQVDVEGKVVLVLRGAPDFSDDFNARDGSLRGKARRARDAGAAALLMVNTAGGDDALFDSARGRPRSYRIPMLHIKREVADEMLAAAGLPDLATHQETIDAKQRPASAALEGVSVRGYVELAGEPTACRNVVALLPGAGPQRDEIIVVGGHYDHLGIRNRDSEDFNPEKDIYNGADDNASGTALTVLLARAMADGPRPNRSFLFILFTAEELGLHGSRHFVEHPTVNLDNCIAMFNFDMVGRMANDVLEAFGMESGAFGDAIRRAAEDHAIRIRDGGGVGGRSDHANFHRKDIPVVFFHTGLHPDYHKPQDDTERLNLRGLARIGGFALDFAAEIDRLPKRPAFQPDDRTSNLMMQADRDRDVEKKQPDDAQPQEAKPEPMAEVRPNRPPVRLGIAARTDDKPGVIVEQVLPDSPAARAGLQGGDRIVGFSEQPIGGFAALRDVVRGLRGGEHVCRLVRDGNELDVRVWLGDRVATETEEEVETGALAETLVSSFEGLIDKGNVGTVAIKLECGSTSMAFKCESSFGDPEAKRELMKTMCRGAVVALLILIPEDVERVWLKTSVDWEMGPDGRTRRIQVEVRA